MKRSRKLISILLTLSLLVTLLVPLAAPAAAGVKSVSALNVVTTQDDTTTTLGTMLVTTSAGAVVSGNTITFRLPSDFKWNAALLVGANLDKTVDGFTYDTAWNGAGNVNNDFLDPIIDLPIKYSGDDNGLYGAQYGVKLLGDD
ncbi:MAG: copper amine oxidase N-terminal domain-containing protein, partial [Desulfocucumaceae bacterium]